MYNCSNVLEIFGSIALGAVLSIPLIYVARLAKSRPLLLVLVLGTIILCVGISNLLGFSVVLANMVIGLAIANWGKRDEFCLVIDDIEDVIFALFFVFVGLHFDMGTLMSTGLLALLIVVCRFSGKYFGARAGEPASWLTGCVKEISGLCLITKGRGFHWSGAAGTERLPFPRHPDIQCDAGQRYRQ